MMRFARIMTGAAVVFCISHAAMAGDAKSILNAAGVKGGLVVHLGCGDGKLTAALRAGDSFLVHGLDADADNVAKARKHVRSLGVYGKVSIDQLTGAALPYDRRRPALRGQPGEPAGGRGPRRRADDRGDARARPRRRDVPTPVSAWKD